MFPVYLPDIKPPIAPHKIQYLIELMIYESTFIGNNGDANNRDVFDILMTNLRHGHIKPVSHPLDNTFNNASFLL
jgi:hypothetical protein